METVDHEDPQAVPHETSPAPPDSARLVSRRWLLLKIGALFNGIVALAVAVPVVGYLIGPIHKRGFYNRWVSLGPLEQFPDGETRLATYVSPFGHPWDGATDKTACWVRRVSANSFQVFAINCTHLGCPVRWFPQSGLFMCPCHGGVYYANGDRAAGPPPRGLFQYKYKVVRNELQIFAGQLPTLATQASLRVPNRPGSGGCKACEG